MALSPFSEFIKKKRLELGLPLKEASRRVRIQPSRIHDLEQGKNSTTGKPTEPTRENIRRLAKGYGVPEELLFELTNHPNIKASDVDEKQLLSLFRVLSDGHKRATLALVRDLYNIDHQF